uniref:NADH:ubiquinone reductase (H(+)-translocating) n=1 Tax=Heterakis beramporia TaxID=596434 RepID=A0A142I177_9BILA|nr:NADH dehydrogenase subunit 5 [Heterakis beramporia]AMR36308.1 NADH dehydrogenase subunit 5 [Heterakis beramporia]
MSILIFLIFFSLLSFFFIYLLPMLNLSLYFLEWGFVSYKLSLDQENFLFSMALLVGTLSVLIFSSYYLNGELNFNYYYFVLLVFVGSMFSLMFSTGGFSMLVSWDILGISSFFLVLFYNNWDSCSGAMNTVLTNRIGDFFLFIFFSGIVFSSWYFYGLSVFMFLGVLLLLLAAFTKSAQFPFSSWLPKAMSAPTPISSLVHSSTLVTAGLILVMNFKEIMLDLNFSSLVMLGGLLTMFFSSVSALFEEDMKKVVALSTLSQMGFCMLTIGLGLSFISLIHMVSHAFFKSCLFMQIGFLIHNSFGQQDGRNYSNLGSVPYCIQLQLLVTLFCLCGLLFSSGAVSKDFILEFFFVNNFWLVLSLLFFCSVFLTFGYSYRLWKGFFISFGKSVFVNVGSVLMNFLSLVLIVMSIFFMWWLGVNLLQVPTLYLYVDFFVPLFFVLLILFFIYFVVKFLLKEVVYKFLVDYFAKFFIYFMKNFKFVDMFLGGVNDKGYNFIMSGSSSFMLLMSNMYYNSLILVIFIVFFLI